MVLRDSLWVHAGVSERNANVTRRKRKSLCFSLSSASLLFPSPCSFPIRRLNCSLLHRISISPWPKLFFKRKIHRRENSADKWLALLVYLLLLSLYFPLHVTCLPRHLILLTFLSTASVSRRVKKVSARGRVKDKKLSSFTLCKVLSVCFKTREAAWGGSVRRQHDDSFASRPSIALRLCLARERLKDDKGDNTARSTLPSSALPRGRVETKKSEEVRRT